MQVLCWFIMKPLSDIFKTHRIILSWCLMFKAVETILGLDIIGQTSVLPRCPRHRTLNLVYIVCSKSTLLSHGMCEVGKPPANANCDLMAHLHQFHGNVSPACWCQNSTLPGPFVLNSFGNSPHPLFLENVQSKTEKFLSQFEIRKI